MDEGSEHPLRNGLGLGALAVTLTFSLGVGAGTLAHQTLPEDTHTDGSFEPMPPPEVRIPSVPVGSEPTPAPAQDAGTVAVTPVATPLTTPPPTHRRRPPRIRTHAS